MEMEQLRANAFGAAIVAIVALAVLWRLGVPLLP